MLPKFIFIIRNFKVSLNQGGQSPMQRKMIVTTVVKKTGQLKKVKYNFTTS